MTAPLALERRDDSCVARFAAMASPCEVLFDTDDVEEAARLARVAAAEAHRIERAYSRYRDDNIVHRLNTAAGAAVTVDDETARLLDYAATCHAMSAGLFDITSGVLRRAWRFDGGQALPDAATVSGLLDLVGWHRVSWEAPALRMLPGMEIDFGGIGKEYAVDRAAALVATASDIPAVINFGGDLAVTAPRRGGRPWEIGIDDPGHTGEAALFRLELDRGGVATSGDARRFLMHEGRRLGHILDPRTGWPVEHAPRAVTVVAPSCLEAGTLSTLALLHGAAADAFLREQGVVYRIV